MKNLRKIFLSGFILGYIIISFLYNPNYVQKSTLYDQSFEQFQNMNRQKARLLLNEYNAEMFDCNNTGRLLNKTIVLDSTIVGISGHDGKYFLKASIRSDCDKKVYAMIKCSLKVMQQYNRGRSNHAFITAVINKVENINTIAEADSLDGDSAYLKTGSSILLTGDCLALTEIPYFSDIN